MDIYVLGHKGLVGSELVRAGCEPVECDITNKTQVRNAILSREQGIWINCAAITDIDYCEKEPHKAFDVNVRGVNNVCSYLPEGTPFIQLSSDHIFSGHKWIIGYSEGHNPSPVNVYGHSKWMAETVALSYQNSLQVKIIRTSKLFDSEYVGKYVTGLPIEITNTIKRSFLHVHHFVLGLLWVVGNLDICPKIVNISGTSILSYYQFIYQANLKIFGYDENLFVPKSHYVQGKQADRPQRGGLKVGLAKYLGVPLYSYLDGLELLK